MRPERLAGNDFPTKTSRKYFCARKKSRDVVHAGLSASENVRRIFPGGILDSAIIPLQVESGEKKQVYEDIGR